MFHGESFLVNMYSVLLWHDRKLAPGVECSASHSVWKESCGALGCINGRRVRRQGMYIPVLTRKSPMDSPFPKVCSIKESRTEDETTCTDRPEP